MYIHVTSYNRREKIESIIQLYKAKLVDKKYLKSPGLFFCHQILQRVIQYETKDPAAANL